MGGPAVRGGSPTNRRDGGQVGAEAEARIQPEVFPWNRRAFGRRPGCVHGDRHRRRQRRAATRKPGRGLRGNRACPHLDLGLLASGTRRGWLSSHRPAGANWEMQVLGAQCLLKVEAIEGSRPCPGLAPREQGGRGVSGRLRLRAQSDHRSRRFQKSSRQETPAAARGWRGEAGPA